MMNDNNNSFQEVVAMFIVIMMFPIGLGLLIFIIYGISLLFGGA